MYKLYDVVMKHVKSLDWYIECINNSPEIKAMRIYDGWYNADGNECIRLRNIITDETMELTYEQAKEMRPRGAIEFPGGFSFIVLDKLLLELYQHVFVDLPSFTRPDMYIDAKVTSMHSYEYYSGIVSEGVHKDMRMYRLVPDGIAITGDNLHISQLKPKTLYLVVFLNCAILLYFDYSFLDIYAKWILLEG